MIETIFIGINREFAASLIDYSTSIDSVRLVGVEQTLESGLALISDLSPQLVLIDCVYLEEDVGDVLRKIRAIESDVRICLLTMFEDGIYKQYAIAQGADDVIPRDLFAQKFEELLERILQD